MNPEPDPQLILDYLASQLPNYPFDPDIDRDFVHELLDDFDHLDLLEEIKTFRWYHDNQPALRYKNLRVALRRWLTYAWTNQSHAT